MVEIYRSFGVETIFNNDNSIIILKTQNSKLKTQNFNLQESPDIAQTIAVTCFGLGVGCKLTGLHTLKIKETDRLQALKNEIENLGGKVEITENSLSLEQHSFIWQNREKERSVNTYQDHRMAMAFAPLALKTDLIIKDAEVVSKSYPNFWKDLKNIGFQVREI